MSPAVSSFLKEHRRIAVAAVLLAGSLGLFGWVRSVKREPTLPAFQVQRAEFLDVLQFRGELKAPKGGLSPV